MKSAENAGKIVEFLISYLREDEKVDVGIRTNGLFLDIRRENNTRIIHKFAQDYAYKELAETIDINVQINNLMSKIRRMRDFED